MTIHDDMLHVNLPLAPDSWDLCFKTNVKEQKKKKNFHVGCISHLFHVLYKDINRPNGRNYKISVLEAPSLCTGVGQQ